MLNVDRFAEFRGLLVSIGGGAVSAFAPSVVPQGYANYAFYGGLCLLIFGIGLVIKDLWVNKQRRHNMTGDDKGRIFGLDVNGKRGNNPAFEINSIGTDVGPSCGGEVIAHVEPGQSATATRVVQTGPGTAMRVTQNGPGVAFRSVVTSEKKTDGHT